jgi:hypothetical protein
MKSIGEMEAFEEIYHLHHKRVYSICFRMLQNASDAEDLTQQVFIQLFRKLHTFRGESSFIVLAWCFASKVRFKDATIRVALRGHPFQDLPFERFPINFPGVLHRSPSPSPCCRNACNPYTGQAFVCEQPGLWERLIHRPRKHT